MKISCFPKMAALQKFRAIKLGFNKELAKAIGIAEATKLMGKIYTSDDYKKAVFLSKKIEELF
jgi:hypothetical protein